MTETVSHIPCAAAKLGAAVPATAAWVQGRGVENPRLAAEEIVARALGCRRLDLYLTPRRVLTGRQDADIARSRERLAAGEPLQYVIGETAFMGHRIRTDPRALIPRPETELLVDAVLRWDALRSAAGRTIADVGTGTGCIAIALAIALPGARCVGIDVRPEAIQLARENAHLHGLTGRIRFFQADLLAGAAADSLDAVVSNLPYVPSAEYAALPRHIREHEPRTALDGGPDGLAVIARLIPEARAALQPGGRLFLEIGHGQGARATALLAQSGFEDIALERDLAGHDRVVAAARTRMAP